MKLTAEYAGKIPSYDSMAERGMQKISMDKYARIQTYMGLTEQKISLANIESMDKLKV